MHKGKEWTSALRRAMAHRGEGDYRNTLLKIANTVIDRAIDGDVQAWKEIAEREDGKPAQAIIGGGEDDAPINMALRVLFGRD